MADEKQVIYFTWPYGCITVFQLGNLRLDEDKFIFGNSKISNLGVNPRNN